MKITKVDIFCADYDPQAPNEPVFIRIHTDEGICGFGEAGVAYGNSQHAAIGQLRDFASLIIGQNPMQIEKIWNRLQKETFWGLGGGTVIFSAISAIDIALWDIKGKALHAPVYELLGGKMRDEVRAYASQIQFGWDGDAKALVCSITQHSCIAPSGTPISFCKHIFFLIICNPQIVSPYSFFPGCR